MNESNLRRAGEVMERLRHSAHYMQTRYYSEWEQSIKAYRCQRDPELDHNGKPDPTQTSLGMPDTFGYTRRVVARSTAQLPQFRFKARNERLRDLIGHTLMYQWDKAGLQMQQKKHMLQTALLGWSVRAWYWCRNKTMRRRRVNPINQSSWPEIKKSYGIDLAAIQANLPPEEAGAATAEIIANLLLEHGRGDYLPIEYEYIPYEGPSCEFVLAADVFPDPDADNLQKGFLITRRTRSLSWLREQQQFYKSSDPQIAQNIEEMIRDLPGGSQRDRSFLSSDAEDFRSIMERAYGFNHSVQGNSQNYSEPVWTITEEHVPGSNPRLRMVGDQGHFICDIPYPYDLEGRIAFTEAKLLDDLWGPAGDSVPRILSGLQELHNRTVGVRTDLAYSILRPLVGTSDRSLWENPDQLKRGSGMRLVYMRGGRDAMWTHNDGPAAAAVAVGLQDESGLMRMWQMGTGESNMSMAAGVDPQQGRTATGAKLMAFNTDVLTKDFVDMFTATSIRPDAEMMYLLNRSEMTEPVEFDRTPYRRDYSAESYDPKRVEWAKVTPEDFQEDGEIVVEAGSMLAEDDEANMRRAMTVVQTIGPWPNVNKDTLRDSVLTAMGYGSRLAEFIPPPMPQPPAQPPVRANLSVSFNGMDLLANAEALGVPPAQIMELLLSSAGMMPEQQQQQQGPPLPPAGMPVPPGMVPPEMMGDQMPDQDPESAMAAIGLQ